jgi:pimeloyl-ACP methyl ester carboxylesterase
MKNLILLHGALGHTKDFKPYEAFLSEHFKLHILLLHGHGGSDIPAEGLSIELYVEQLKQYIDDNRLESVHIFGYSMGGYVALYYASQNPGKVASILTLAVKLAWSIDAARKETSTLDPEIVEARAPKYTLQLIAKHGEKHWKPLLTYMAKLMIRLAEKPLLNKPEYEALRMPVQLMVGDRDSMVSIEETLDVVRSIANANMAVLPNAKHPMDSVVPDVLLSLMKDFWKIGVK